MKKSISPAWEAAMADGCLWYFWAHMHVGHTIAFVNYGWEEGGFSVDADGFPVRDSRGNTVAKYTVEELDPECAAHVAQVEAWYAGQ